MRRKHRIALREKLGRKVELAVKQALAEAGDSPGLKTVLDDLENYSKLLAATEPSWTRDFVAALAVVIVCVAVAGVLWSCRVERTNVSLTVETDSLHATLAKKWDFEEPLRGQAMHFADLSTVHNPKLGLTIDSADGDVWFRLDGGNIVLQSLQVGQNANLDLFSDKSELGLSIGGAPLRGAVLVTGKGKLTGGTRGLTSIQKSYDLVVPEALEFVAQNSRAWTSDLTIHSPGGWSLGVVPCSDLSFASELRSIAERRIASGIRSGKVQLNDTARPITELFENQLLSVSRANEARIQIRSDHDAMHVTVNGLVSHVMLGDDGVRRELAPSYLEFLYNRKSWLLFCTAVSAGWGLLWGIRKTIFR
jgi:hypothetical protein